VTFGCFLSRQEGKENSLAPRRGMIANNCASFR
jgi:hypothetical protein